MVDAAEILKTVAALMATFGAVVGALIWLMRATIRAEVQPMLVSLDGLHHEHAETRRRVEHLEGRVERLKDDKADRGEVDARIELGLSRVRRTGSAGTE
jgi:HAMP domain-containing protein